MGGLFSLVSVLIVVGLIAWFSIESLQVSSEQNESLQRNGTGDVIEPGGSILIPIDQAEDARNLIESRSRESVGL
jgi:uncharacterized membrane protein YqiK